MSTRAEIQEMLRKAKLAGAERIVALLEDDLRKLDEPTPQKIIDCERAAELGAEYRRAQANDGVIEQSGVTDAEVAELAASDPTSQIFYRQVTQETKRLIAELKRLGIAKPRGGQR